VLFDIHASFAWFVVITNGLAGAWALAANWVEALRVRALWWFVAVAEISIFVQVAIGVGLFAVDDRDAPQFHTFYGFVALAAVGIIYSYRQQVEQYKYVLYGLGSWFLMGLAIRSMVLHR
jgi:hypothetical protein